MAKTHWESVLTTACIQTPVNPHTRTPITLYEREEEERRKLEAERPAEDDLYSDSDMEREDHSKTSEARDWYLDISRLQNSNQEYYMQIEKLKSAHLQSMEQLERMYQQKLHLKGVQYTDPDQKMVRNECRPLWEREGLRPTLCGECLLKHDLNSNVSSGSFDGSVDELAEGDVCSDSEESISIREKIAEMWDGFAVEDYIQHTACPKQQECSGETSKTKSKEWTHRLTIPEPFQMTVRESKKKKKTTKSKSDIELENNLLKRALEEEEECQKKFRANPVPASVYLPLYHEIVARNEERRKFVKERSKDLLLASQKPFQFTEREEQKKALQKVQLTKFSNPENQMKHFKAKPVPKSIYGSSAQERLKEEELYRGIRTHMRAQELLHSSAYPTSTLACGTKSGNRKTRCFQPKEQLDHKPKINTFVPKFEALHKKNHENVLKSKSPKHVTVCEPFHLRTDHISHKDKILRDIEADEEHLKETRWPYKSPRTATPRRPSWEAISPHGEALSSTPRATESSRRRQQAIRKQEKQRSREYLEELEAMKERVSKTPLLLERATQKNAFLSAEKHYSEVLRNLGLSEDFVSRKGNHSDPPYHVPDKEEERTDDGDSSEGTLELEDLEPNDWSDKNGSARSDAEEEQEEYSTDSDHSETGM
uniref:Protein FAM161A n=1 Tax=Leptobrachium leishanense TaxID=445787 RepID=A0A8C5MAS6_9ANUR